MVKAKTLCYGCRQQQDNKTKQQFGRNRGIPKTQRVLASTNIQFLVEFEASLAPDEAEIGPVAKADQNLAGLFNGVP